MKHFLNILLSLFLLPSLAHAGEETETFSQWGGHLRATGSVVWPASETALRAVDSGPLYDGVLEFRLKNRFVLDENIRLDSHYEMIPAGGDSWRAASELRRLPDSLPGLGCAIPSDDHRFFDFTSSLSEKDDRLLYHRLDRFVLTVDRDWGRVRLGRQALSWGNGLLFNPMDLFNPFSPTDISRDYKTGDDMVLFQPQIPGIDDLQFLVVPGRNPQSRNLGRDYSSFAAKAHFYRDELEFDLLAARHLRDNVAGLGLSGFWRDAAWRCDFVWTDLPGESDRDDFFSLAANVDYSWTWFDKNWYGFVELYHNSLGWTDYDKALHDEELTERIERGELFVLGRTYIAFHLQCELHPLFHVFLTTINNLEDPSGLLQPYLTLSIEQNIQLTMGAALYYGGHGSEYGGFSDPASTYRFKAPSEWYLWITAYF